MNGGDRMNNYTSLLQIAWVEARGSKRLCLLRRISPDRALIAIRFNCPLGSEVLLGLRDGQERPARVVSEKEGRVELSFTSLHQKFETGAFSSTQSEETRQMIRVDRRAPVILETETQSYLTELINISLQGIHVVLRDDQILDPNDDISVVLHGHGRRRCRAIWANECAAGLEFAMPLRFEELDDWLGAEASGRIEVDTIPQGFA